MAQLPNQQGAFRRTPEGSFRTQFSGRDPALDPQLGRYGSGSRTGTACEGCP